MSTPANYPTKYDVPVHVYDLTDVPVPRGQGFYYNIPLDADTGVYIPPDQKSEVVLEGPFLTAIEARDAAFALIQDAIEEADANEACFGFVDEDDLANMDVKGSA